MRTVRNSGPALESYHLAFLQCLEIFYCEHDVLESGTTGKSRSDEHLDGVASCYLGFCLTAFFATAVRYFYPRMMLMESQTSEMLSLLRRMTIICSIFVADVHVRNSPMKRDSADKFFSLGSRWHPSSGEGERRELHVAAWQPTSPISEERKIVSLLL